MENVRVAFEVFPDGKSVPVSHQFVRCHMEDFRQKARLAAGGHMTEALAIIMYDSVV